MTALDRFVRLESGGLWREDKDAQRKDMTVSFGKTTLVLSDSAGRAVTHWSLPAVRRLNPGKRPALYAPDKDADEVLEIEDDLMIDAIEEVRKALIIATPHPGRVRSYLTAGLAAAAVAATAWFAPSVIRDTAVNVVPDSKTEEIGAAILGHYQRIAGATCNSGPGTTALAQLHTRLFGAEARGRLVVVSKLPQGAVALPGNMILIDRTLIEDHDDPVVVASHVLAAAAAFQADETPMARLVEDAKLTDTMALLTTGDMPSSALRAHAVTLASGAFAPEPDLLDATYAAAASAPQAGTRRGIAMPATVTRRTGAGHPLLDDNAWVRLQNICHS